MSGSTVYAGGDFVSIGGQTRNYIAALDAASGLPTSWNPNADGAVYALALSDSTIYAGGDFTKIGAQSTQPTRNRIAALNAMDTGNATSWDPNANERVFALAVQGSTVYAGGEFTIIGGATRNRLAALNDTGNATSWDPGNLDTDGPVKALAVSLAARRFMPVGSSLTLEPRRPFRRDTTSLPWMPIAAMPLPGTPYPTAMSTLLY